jgi:predicted glycosyltransferase
MHLIATGLREAHDVHLVEGGRPVPRPAWPSEPARLALPALTRAEPGGMAGVGDRLTHELRARELVTAVARLRPDVVIVDHYPFSKWELGREIEGAVTEARTVNDSVCVLCSLRDVVRQTRHERVSRHQYEARVLELLRSHFDGILVHSDPAFTRLEDHFGAAGDIPLPVHYTGFVAEPPLPPFLRPAAPYAVASCGGSRRGLPMLAAAIEAFRRLSEAGGLDVTRLLVFPSPYVDESDLDVLRRAAAAAPVVIEGFSTSFGAVLGGAQVSISRAGYNTSAAVLLDRVRAVLVPDPEMSDQGPRAELLGAAGLATVVPDDGVDVDALASGIAAAVAGPRPEHAYNCDGVAGTRRVVEAIANREPG